MSMFSLRFGRVVSMDSIEFSGYVSSCFPTIMFRISIRVSSSSLSHKKKNVVVHTYICVYLGCVCFQICLQTNSNTYRDAYVRMMRRGEETLLTFRSIGEVH